MNLTELIAWLNQHLTRYVEWTVLSDGTFHVKDPFRRQGDDNPVVTTHDTLTSAVNQLRFQVVLVYGHKYYNRAFAIEQVKLGRLNPLWIPNYDPEEEDVEDDNGG